jgi:hypothetical protein
VGAVYAEPDPSAPTDKIISQNEDENNGDKGEYSAYFGEIQEAIDDLERDGEGEKVGVTWIQKRFKVGYGKAAKIWDAYRKNTTAHSPANGSASVVYAEPDPSTPADGIISSNEDENNIIQGEKTKSDQVFTIQENGADFVVLSDTGNLLPS